MSISHFQITNNMEAKDKNQQKQPELSERFLHKRRMAMLLPVPIIIVCTFIFWLFDGGSNNVQANSSGLNPEIPAPKQEGIVADKMLAYEQAEAQRKEQEKLQAIQDYVSGQERPQQKDSALLKKNEADQLLDQVNSFEEPKESERIRELEARIAQMEQQQNSSSGGGGGSSSSDRYMQLMEKQMELQLAEQQAKLQPQTNSGQQRKVVAVKLSKKATIVSSLDGEVSNDFSSVSTKEPELTNGIEAAVHGKQSVIPGESIQLRLLTSIEVGGQVVAAGTLISGVTTLSGERLQVEVSSLVVKGELIPVALQAYDLDGLSGLYIPDAVNVQAGKQVLSDVVGGSNGGGFQVTMPKDAKQMILMEGARSVVGTGKRLLGSKVSTIKLHLPANYHMYLIESK